MRLLPLVAATALVVAVAGCGSGGDSATSTTSSTSSTPSDAAAVAYMDKVCTAMASFTTTPRTPPKLDENDPAKRKADWAVYMGQLADASTQTATRLREVGPSPVAGGGEQVEKLAVTYTDLAKNFSDAKAATEAADANDPVGGLQAAGEAIARMDAFGEPLKQFEPSPELASAGKKAEACQDLRTLQPTESVVPTS